MYAWIGESDLWPSQLAFAVAGCLREKSGTPEMHSEYVERFNHFFRSEIVRIDKQREAGFPHHRSMPHVLRNMSTVFHNMTFFSCRNRRADSGPMASKEVRMPRCHTAHQRS